ncbi:MAG: pullulanase X25 domain-containing protein, partial [Planctomycetota bacterium]
EAASFGQPISEYDPASKGQLDFKDLAQEVIKSEKTQQRRDLVSSLANQLTSISTSANELLKSEKIQKQTTEIQEIKPEYEQKPPQPEPVEVVSQLAEATETVPIQTFSEPPEPMETPSEQEQVESTPAEPIPMEEPLQEPDITQPENMEPEPVEPEQQEPEQEQVESNPDEPIPTKEEPAPDISQPEQIQPGPVETEEAEQESELPTIESTNSKISDYYGVNQINEAVIFVSLYPRASLVQVAGDFNNWQPSEMSMEKVGESGIWQTKMNLSPGKYQYRLVIDGHWQQDPYNENSILNPYGEFNSVLEVT